jgi:glycosyltransferase involved in cell wall biosynthesis
VVYNAFPPYEPPLGAGAAARAPGPPALLWFSQTVGPGRGLERLFLALDRLEFPVALTLTGDCGEGTRGALEAAFPRARGHRLAFVPRVPPGNLAAHIAFHDAGLALEEERPESRDRTVTNKVLQCLASGIPVVATPTRGQREAGAATPAVRVAASFGPEDLAAALRGLLGSPEALAEGKRQAREAARGPLSWERSARVLVGAVEAALSKGGGSP